MELVVNGGPCVGLVPSWQLGRNPVRRCASREGNGAPVVGDKPTVSCRPHSQVLTASCRPHSRVRTPPADPTAGSPQPLADPTAGSSRLPSCPAVQTPKG